MNSEKLKYSGILVWVLYAGLLAVQTFYTLIIPPMGKTPNAVVWVFFMAPLLVFLPFMLKQSAKAYIGLCIVLLLYFLLAIVNVVRPDFGYSAYLELFFSVSLLVATMVHVRFLQQARPKPKPDTGDSA